MTDDARDLEPPRMDKTLRRLYRCTFQRCTAITERPALERWTHLSDWGNGIRDGFCCPAHTAAIIDDDPIMTNPEAVAEIAIRAFPERKMQPFERTTAGPLTRSGRAMAPKQ